MFQNIVLMLLLINSSPSDGQAKTDLNEISAALNEFAFHLYKEVGSSVQGQNVVMSPFSISSALSMVYLGARGRTRSQMAAALRLNAFDATPNISNAAVGEMFKTLMKNVEQTNLTQTKVRPGFRLPPPYSYNIEAVLKVANRLFGEKTFAFEKKYLRQVKSYFNSSLKSLDFSGDQGGSRRYINSWVRKQTFRRITDLLPDGMITNDTKLILINAMYFKGFWEKPFAQRWTTSKTFHVSRQETTSVQMMEMSRAELRYQRSSELECDVVQLPYFGNRYSMHLFVPHEIDGLAKVESRLNATSFNRILHPHSTGMVDTSYKRIPYSRGASLVDLSLPKFTIKHKVELISYLTKMGIKDAFDKTKADLTGIGKSRPLVLDEAVHEAFVGVNEEGTEAAAATMLRALGTSLSYEIKADRPFLFLIVEKTTDIVLFIGRLADPRL